MPAVQKSGLFDWTQALLGQPNANEQLAQLSDQQAMANARAVQAKPDATGPGAQSQGIQPPQPASPEPLAYQTPASWGRVQIDLQQQNERQAGFNTALGGIGAAISQPRNREWVSKLFDQNIPDASKTVSSVMDLNAAQQGMDVANSVRRLGSGDPAQQAQLEALATSMHADPRELAVLARTDPKGFADLIARHNTLTPTIANLDQIQRFQADYKARHPDASPQALDDAAQAIKNGLGGPEAEPMLSAQDAWRKDPKNAGKPPPWTPNDLTSFHRWNADQTQLEADQHTAKNALPAAEAKLSDTEQKLREIEDDPALPGVLKKWLPAEGKWALASMTDAERALSQKIDLMSSAKYVEGLSDPNMGTRKTQLEMEYIGKYLGGALNNRTLAAPDFKKGLHWLQDRLYDAHAGIYGEAGDFSGMDEKYAGSVGDAYRDGGQRAIANAPKRKPLDDDAKTFWAQGVKSGASKDEMRQLLKRKNYDTKGLD